MSFFAEGFDRYELGLNEADDTWMAGRWTVVDGGQIVSRSTGRGYAINVGDAIGQHAISRVIFNPGVATLAFAFRLEWSGDHGNVIDFRDGTDILGMLGVTSSGNLRWATSHEFRFNTHDFGLSVSEGVEAWISGIITFHGSTGSVKVAVNAGTPEEFTGDTINAGSVCTLVRLGSINFEVSSGSIVDDLLIWDPAAGLPSPWNDATNPIGPKKIGLLAPTGTDSNTMAITGAATAHEALDDSEPDEDTTYVEADADDEAVMLTHGGTSEATIHAVVNSGRFRSDGATAKKVALRVDDGGTAEEAGGVVPSETYSYIEQVVHTRPNGGGAWTEAAVDALKFGWARRT